MPVRIIRILNTQSDYRIPPHVFIFSAALRTVDDNMFAVEFEPDRRDLRRTIAHESCELSERFLLKQIRKAVGNCAHLFPAPYSRFLGRSVRSKFTTASPLAVTVTSCVVS